MNNSVILLQESLYKQTRFIEREIWHNIILYVCVNIYVSVVTLIILQHENVNQ